MVIEATITIPSDESPLGSVFEAHPGVTVEFERIIPMDIAIIPYFWVRNGEADDIVATFGDYPGMRDVEMVDHVDGQFLMRGEWNPEYASILTGLVESEVTLLTGEGTVSDWAFTVRGDTQEAVAAFQQYCRDYDIPITITTLHKLTPVHTPDFDLTDTQRDALLLAFELGYFDSPRDASLKEVADELGITHQAMASRLRRGTRRLIAGSITAER